MTYQATDESIRAHTAPNWFHDAKLGIFIHWGLYSVPGYAPYSDTDIMTLFKQQGFAAMRQNPYAEWYLNTPYQARRRGRWCRLSACPAIVPCLREPLELTRC